MKFLLLVLVSISLIACQSTPTKTKKVIGFVITWDHHEYGTVKLPDERWSMDTESCKHEFFNNGVMSDGETITDMKQLEKLKWEYTKWKLIQVGLTYKDRLPARFSGISNLDSYSAGCMKSRGWHNRKSKTIYE